jgi:hypothetical protein
MFTAKQSDSVGGGVVFDIRCTSVTAGTNTASPAAMGITLCGVAIVLWTLGRTAAEMTRHVIAAMDNKPPVFMGTSSWELRLGRLSARNCTPESPRWTRDLRRDSDCWLEREVGSLGRTGGEVRVATEKSPVVYTFTRRKITPIWVCSSMTSFGRGPRSLTNSRSQNNCVGFASAPRGSTRDERHVHAKTLLQSSSLREAGQATSAHCRYAYRKADQLPPLHKTTHVWIRC